MMELELSPEMMRRLGDAGIREEEVRLVWAAGGGVLDPEDGTVTKGAQIGSVTLWITVRPTQTGYSLVKAYEHRMTVDGVEACPGK